MLTKTWKSRLLTAMAVVPLTAVWSLNPAPVESGSANSLEGVWEIQGHPDPQSGVQPFVNFGTITHDGKVINVDPEVGTGVGEVVRVRGDTYSIAFHGFLDVGVPARYEVQGTLTLDARAGLFSGPFVTTVRDETGQVLFTYGGTVDGWRQSLRPL